MLVTEMIRRGARQFGDDVAVVFGNERMTFSEVDRFSNQLANALLSRVGIAPGSRVGLLLNNSLNSIPMDFALAKASFTRVPLNARLAAAEHAEMIRGAGVNLLIHDASLADRARELAAMIPELAVLGLDPGAAGDGLIALGRASPETPPEVPIDPSDVVLALYTSGTTGTLKAAQHTQATFAAVATNILTNLIDVQRGDRMLHAASLIHASGTFVLPYWIRGGAAVVLPNFQPLPYLEEIAKARPTAINLVPTMIGMLLDSPAIETADMSSVETIVYGASPMPRATIERGLALWGPRFVQYYGQSEAPLCITVLKKEDHVGEGAAERLLACGQPSVDCEVRLLDENDNDVAFGQPGEIAVRAPFAMVGYLDAPEINARTLLPGGWIRTRDVGRFDERGYLYLVDRTSDMIVTGGYNVYPREVEDALASHPAVREVVVVGIPDEKWGEAVTAFVALRADCAPDEPGLIEHARSRLAGYKIPKSVRFIDEVPKSAVGKLLRRAVRDPFWAGRERRI